MSGNDNAPAAEEEMLAAIAGSSNGALVDPTEFHRTDAGNAGFFVSKFGADLRFVEAWGKWRVWNGTRWIEASDTALVPFAIAATEHMMDWAKTLPDRERTDLRRHALATQKRERLLAMIGLAKGDLNVRAKPDLFDANPLLLGCEGVTIDLSGTRPKPHRPRREDFITKSTGVTPDPKASCPNWLATLDWVFDSDAATIEHVQRIAGYSLTGSVIEEKLFAFFGGGANGKTTVVMTLFEMLGEYAGRASSNLLLEAQGQKGAASPDIAALHGKRLVVASETDDQCSLAEAQVKAITSNEPIAARSLYRDPFTFKPTHKTILMTNHRPFVKGTDNGIWRRLNIVGFEQQMPDDAQIKDFRVTRLWPELPAILAWAINGCMMYRRDGLKPSPAVKAATGAYRSEMDFVGQWVAERTVPDQQERVSRSVAYGDYEDWAKTERAPILGNRRFGEELNARGYPTTRTHGSRFLNGLKLKGAGSFHVIQGGAAATP